MQLLLDEALADTIELPKGELLFRQGESVQFIYFLVSGALKLFQEGLQGRDVISELWLPGDFCVFNCLSGQKKHFASASATCPSTIIRYPEKLWPTLKASTPQLHSLSHSTCQRQMGCLRKRLNQMALQSAEARLAALLLQLEATNSSTLPSGESNNIALIDTPSETRTIDWPLSRRDISEYIGTTSETAMRILSAFRKKNYIYENEGKFAITDKKALLKIENCSRP